MVLRQSNGRRHGHRLHAWYKVRRAGGVTISAVLRGVRRIVERSSPKANGRHQVHYKTIDY